METPSGRFNVVIIGGGPAGMSAALWCAETGLSAIIIERENELGGQLHLIHNPIRNYIGLETANGLEMKQGFLANLSGLNIERSFGVAVEDVNLESRVLMLTGGRTIEGDTIILATGVRRRQLNVPGEKEFEGRGILNSGSLEKLKATDKTVVIVGGGDAALENALILSGFASKVILVHRRSEFSARREFVIEAHSKPNIEFLTNAIVTSINGDQNLKYLIVQGLPDKTQSRISTDLLLIRVGVVPNTEFVKGKIEMDERGYISVDARGETSVPQVYAVGDVAHPYSPTVSTAVGTGATAIKAILSRPIK